MKKLTRKQFIKRYTEYLMFGLTESLLTPEQAKDLTMDNVRAQFPKVSHYKDAKTGVIRVGLSFRGVRKLVKKYGKISVQDVRTYFNLGKANA